MTFSNTMMKPGNFNVLGANIERELQNHKGKYIFQGILFIIAGIIAAVFPASAAISVEMIIGAILLIMGIFRLALAVKSKMHWWSVLSAILSIFIGIILLFHPLPVIVAFVTILAIFMTIEGTLEVLLSFQFRTVRNWIWMFFSGVVTLVLALALWMGWPLLGIFYIGFAIAINLIFYGFSLLMLVRSASRHMYPREKN